MLNFIGMGLSMYAKYKQAEAIADASGKASLEAFRTAVRQRIQARMKARDIRDEGAEYLSSMTTRYAKAGVVVDSGSPLLYRAHQLANIERDALRMEMAGDEAYRANLVRSDAIFEAGQSAAEGARLQMIGTAVNYFSGNVGGYQQGSLPDSE